MILIWSVHTMATMYFFITIYYRFRKNLGGSPHDHSIIDRPIPPTAISDTKNISKVMGIQGSATGIS